MMHDSMNFTDWRVSHHNELRNLSFSPSSTKHLTILAYFFWNDERLERDFWTIEFSFRQTFSLLGRLPAVLVTNRETDDMRRLSSELGVEIQVEPSLTRGLPSMSLDCISRLHERFATDQVLIIQNDGFPLRDNISDFLGKYDYIGAPWPGHCTNYDLFPYPKFGVGNGGFSLRSKALCKYVSDCYHRYFRYIPYNWFFTEDVFFCKTLPLLNPGILRKFHYASIAEAIPFSYEFDVPGHPITEMPFGFHSPKGFNALAKRFPIA